MLFYNYYFISNNLNIFDLTLQTLWYISENEKFMSFLYTDYTILLFVKTVTVFLYSLWLKTNSINAIFYALKFLILIALLVFVRGGIPRYRYDFLTKIGWIKFLTLILVVFISSLLLVYLM